MTLTRSRWVRILAYTLTVANGGLDDVADARVSDTLAIVTFVAALPSQGSGSEAGGVVTCEIDNLSSGDSATVEIVVIPNDSDMIANQAGVEVPVRSQRHQQLRHGGHDSDRCSRECTITGTEATTS